MKTIKTLVLAILLLGAGYSAHAYATSKPIWNWLYQSNGTDTFLTDREIKVYSFKDGTTTCYVAINPTKQSVPYNSAVDGINQSISCVK